MKIVQINAVYGYGSTGIIVQDIQTACLNEGIDCVVAYSHSNESVRNGYRLGNAFSNKLHALLSRISGRQGYFSWLPTFFFMRFLDNYKPDILHLHNLHSNFINLPMLLNYAATNNIAVVVSLHDCWFYTGKCSHYTNVGCTKWKSSCGKCPKRKDEFPAILWDDSRKLCGDKVRLFGTIRNLSVVGVSQWITDESRINVFKSARCLAIHNGIDTSFFRPTKSNFRKRYRLEDKFIILAPSNKWFLPVNKDTLDYITSNLKDNMVIVFFGGEIQTELPKNSINCGFISSREELRDIYSAVDVMVNCTREESLSLLNIEVQACGTPVVTYANTGVQETVDGTCGFAVENGNPVAIWNAIMRVAEKGKNYYSESCRNWVNCEFDRNKNYQKYIELYKSVLA